MKLQVGSFLCFLIVHTNAIHLKNAKDNVHMYLDGGESVIATTIKLDDETKFTGFLGHGRNLTVPKSCEGSSKCVIDGDDVTLAIDSIDGGFSVSWQTNNTEATFQDCLQLNASAISWFGGPEKWQADWPLENLTLKNRLYITIKSDNGAVSERYWLTSKGGYVFIDDDVPLYVDQNNISPTNICFMGAAIGPYIGRDKVTLSYKLVVKSDPKEAHLHAVNNYLGKPTEHPNEWIIRNPIWTTWAKYKRDINDDVVVNFAKEIAGQGYKGQIEIDDYWETCYGSLTFNDKQFPKINETVQKLKDLGFTVALWVHPFVNTDCAELAKYGQEHGLFVKSYLDDSDITSWWDGSSAHYIDFRKEEAQKWFTDRLKLLQELHGIDTFKFDAGESDYAPQNPVLVENPEKTPNLVTSSYVRTCANFGDLIEVRSAWRTQDLNIFLRMLDRDSRWGLNNGLHSLIVSLIQLNLSGYVFILPDMIGGNGYGNEFPSPDLIMRWTQANTFMPSMQFSYLPWDLGSEEYDVPLVVKKFVDLHAEYADNILAAMNASIANGTPVNPPIWWVDPTNLDAYKVNDEYLLGESILVAPVVQEGALERDVFLPAGSWKDGNNGSVYEGPLTLKDYPAPMDVLPYFIKV